MALDAEPEDVRTVLRRTVSALVSGLLPRLVIFLPLFLWARSSEIGAAALRGAVGGDIFAWAALSLLTWPLRRVQAGAGALLELVLVGLYLQREAIFEISSDIGMTTVSLMFFFLVLFGKTGAWAVTHALQLSGVTESE